LAQMATNPAGAAETTVAGDDAAALPPQLNEMLGDAAPKVASFAELVRGVSWTQQLMEDVSHQLRNFGAFRVALDDVPGFAKIHVLLVHCTRKQKKQELRELHAEVSCCRRVLDRPQHSSIAEHPRFQNIPGHSAGRQGCNLISTGKRAVPFAPRLLRDLPPAGTPQEAHPPAELRCLRGVPFEARSLLRRFPM